MTTITYMCDVGDGPISLPVRGLSRKEWAHLCYAHPLDNEVFPAALISACTGKSFEEAQHMWDEWPTLIAEELFEKCLELSQPTGWDWAKQALHNHARLMVEMTVCEHYGIPHSHFLGWPDTDQDLAIAAFIEGKDKCPGCGAPSEAMSNPLLAEIRDRRCLKCVELKGVRESIPDAERSFIHLNIVRSDE